MPTWLRLAVLYAAMNFAFGISSPFASLWFKAHGLDGTTIGMVLAAPMLGRAATGPLIAVFAEGFRSERTGIALVAVGAAASYGLIQLLGGLPAWAVLWFLANSLMGALNPLTDAVTLRTGREQGFDYGRPRAVGSASFVLSVIGGGWLVQHAGVGVLMPCLAACAVACALAARTLLPSAPGHLEETLASTRARWARVGRLVGDRRFMLAIVSAGLINATHGFYYSFSTLVWRGQGIEPGLVGILWGIGTAADVVFLWFGGRWRTALGPERLLLLGGLGAAVRWSLYALQPPLWALVPLQAMHVLSFACTFIASLQLAERLSPPEAAASAQTLNNALSSGVLIGAATLASGRLFDLFGAGGYWLMAAIAGVGSLGAVVLMRIGPAPVGVGRRR